MENRSVENSAETFSFILKEIDLIEKSMSMFNKRSLEIEFDFDISLRIAPNLSRSESFHLMSVGILNKSSQKKIGSVSIGFVFNITDLASIAVIKGENITLPKKLNELLNAVVIGTTRGIMFSEFRGTVLEEAILPVVDPSRFQKA